jgi:hypothetical protein
VKRLPPVYPVAIAVAYVLAVYSSGDAVPSDLIRPVLIAIAIAIAVQVVATLLARDRDRGALVAAVLIAAVPLQSIVFVGLLGLLALLILPGSLARARGGATRPAPWESTTRLLNLVAVIVLVVSTGQLIAGGRLAPSRAIAEPRASAEPGAPDIYVILLDGHPRWDTLANEFGYDTEPFLAAMEAEGFDVARESRSNYNMTELTLASMFQMRQLRDISGFADTDPARAQQQQSLKLADLVARAPGFDELHKHGYEVVDIPSEFTWLAPPADRSLDGGQINDLEIGLLVESRLRTLAPDQVRGFVAAQHRDRIHDSLERLSAIAEERPDGPRFVFAHLMSPHPPFVFGPGGEPRDGWPCFPSSCLFWGEGDPLGRETEVAAVRAQVEYVDAAVLETVRSIVAASARPPVIVLMSDHGSRLVRSDHAEMLRSLFLARTPGHPELFPNATTPVNLIPRLLNAYAGADLPLASEESYWTDIDAARVQGQFELVPFDPDGPPS